MITKTYQALHAQTYDMYVEYQGKRLLIPFRGGSLKPAINGKFQTSDKKLQIILAGDSSYGVTFKEIGSFDDEQGDAKPVGKNVEVVYGIVTVLEARDFLISRVPGTTANKLPNKTAVLKLAGEHGYTFPNMEPLVLTPEEELKSKTASYGDHLDNGITPKGQESLVGTTQVVGVTTVQAAREYLLENVEGLTTADLPNKVAVLEKAEAHSIAFPDLK